MLRPLSSAQKASVLSALHASGVSCVTSAAQTNWLKPLRPARQQPALKQTAAFSGNTHQQPTHTSAAAEVSGPSRAAAPVVAPSSGMAPSVPQQAAINPTAYQQAPKAAQVLKPKPAAPEKEAELLFAVHIHGPADALAQVCVAADILRADKPQFLPREEEALLEKMLGSIGLAKDKIAYVVLGASLPVGHGEAPEGIRQKLRDEKGSQPCLVFGEVAAKALGQETYIVPHPRLILAQPMLKKLAWHVLQAFKKEVLDNA